MALERRSVADGSRSGDRGEIMSAVKRLLVAASFLVFPASAFAQASITGVVKDASGAVLPGVIVEASSDALIEKVRSAVTDGTGQYRIVDLRRSNVGFELYNVTNSAAV